VVQVNGAPIPAFLNAITYSTYQHLLFGFDRMPDLSLTGTLLLLFDEALLFIKIVRSFRRAPDLCGKATLNWLPQKKKSTLNK